MTHLDEHSDAPLCRVLSLHMAATASCQLPVMLITMLQVNTDMMSVTVDDLCNSHDDKGLSRGNDSSACSVLPETLSVLTRL